MSPAFVLTLLATGFFLVSLLFLATRKPGYSHLRHTISELGEVGAPDQRLVAFGMFLPIGVLLLVAAFLMRSNEPHSLLALCIGVGYVVATFFPCDPGSPVTGTTRQSVHNLGGAVEYIGGAFALWKLGESLGLPFQVAAFVVFSAALFLSIPEAGPIRGLIQRLAEACLFGGLLWSAAA